MTLKLGMDRFEGFSGQRAKPKTRFAPEAVTAQLFGIAVLVIVVILFVTQALGTPPSPNLVGAEPATRAPCTLEDEAVISPRRPIGSPYPGESVAISSGGSLHLMK